MSKKKVDEKQNIKVDLGGRDVRIEKLKKECDILIEKLGGLYKAKPTNPGQRMKITMNKTNYRRLMDERVIDFEIKRIKLMMDFIKADIAVVNSQ